MSGTRSRLQAASLALWPLLLSCVLCGPLLWNRGDPLSRDLVFVPQQPLTEATFGLGEGLPRAVPLDAVVGVLGHVLDGGVLARLLVPVSVALAGWGVQVLLRDAGWAGRFAAAGLAVWNPFVVERLALGQWALLLGYGALPWVLAFAARYRRHGRVGDLAVALLAAALASVTPTGGLLACAAVVAAALGRTWRWVPLLLGGLLLQAPWVVAALLSEATATSDPAGVRVFGPDTAGPGGPVVALLGLGGIWDDASEPATRGTWVAVAAAMMTCVLLVAGGAVLRRWWGGGDLVRVTILAGAFASVPLSVSLGGDQLLGEVVATVPGAGLLRDSQKLLAPGVVLVVAAFGASVDAARVRAARHGPEVLVSGLLVSSALPIVLLPDATTVTWPTVEPVRYPDQVREAYRTLDGESGEHRVAVLPWRSYRLFSWGNGTTSSDPAVRWLRSEVLVSDSLQVGPTLVRGESRLLREVGAALDESPPAEALPRFGVDRVLLYRDDPDASQVDTEGLVPLQVDDLVAVYEVPKAMPRREDSAVRLVGMVAAHLLWLVVACGACVVTVVARSKALDAGPRRGGRNQECV